MRVPLHRLSREAAGWCELAIQEDVVILRCALDPEIFRVEVRALAIDSVTRDGGANVTQVDPNLVGSASFGLNS